MFTGLIVNYILQTDLRVALDGFRNLSALLVLRDRPKEEISKAVMFWGTSQAPFTMSGPMDAPHLLLIPQNDLHMIQFLFTTL